MLITCATAIAQTGVQITVRPELQLPAIVIARRMSHRQNECGANDVGDIGRRRRHRVTLDRQVNDEDLKKLRKGVRLEDGPAKASTAEMIEGSKRKKVLLMLREGRNREVRRMFEVIGHDVRQLDRVSFAGLTPLGLPRGSSRYLTRSEVNNLKKLTGAISRKEIDEISS